MGKILWPQGLQQMREYFARS